MQEKDSELSILIMILVPNKRCSIHKAISIWDICQETLLEQPSIFIKGKTTHNS